MQVHPAIAALRADRAAQRVMQEEFLDALEPWQTHANTIAIRKDVEAYAEGRPLKDCVKLDRLLSDAVFATAFVQVWQRSMIAALRQYPLGIPTFAHRGADALANIILMAKGNASLGITVYEEANTVRKPKSAVFSDRQMHECVISGSADGVMHEVRQCDGIDTLIDTCSVYWRPGAIIVTHGPCEARQVVSVKGAMVVLQLSRQASHPQPTREYSLHDGALIQSASGDKLASQKVMALSVLGAMAARGEAPGALQAMVRCANDLNEDADARWEAVRQTLACNPAQGIALLEMIAANTSDPLTLPALHLRDLLRSDQPELEHLFACR
ncbi:hypothetical protein [Erythrobacter sp. YT30]|uniref:hypothetical protein n=1 Tax=Erythrobacter sp. YT30 TaxID=1735012 RepID=UPI00076DE731|nr:hypothetical protein [Erythrobacter sp. YT30]KWV90559.1 hypothetical protein AUC45_15120 [Erythrobacter sp. YT30]